MQKQCAVEICSKEIPSLTADSKQEWIDINDFVPSHSKDSHNFNNHFEYLCITERPHVFYVNSLSSRDYDKLDNPVDKAFEMCYWNDLSMRF